ncbi:hypothetical protein FOZ62_021899 [Perkinsus olseni]|uniref:Uncharacterized protein n=1 Tax=Perkinsus olseni TaxID=32597 RepID=A0A7J6TZE4_PEROL|nr:hypothetical protein FOZ62_021899 [Perkinsus olseni]
MLRTSFMIVAIIPVIHAVIANYGDAFWGNDSVGSSNQSPPLRYLRLPVVAEEPPNCLPPTDYRRGKNYCWYILENSLGTEVHSGMLIRSNTSGWGWYVTLEHLASVADSLPTDVGVWAEGRTLITTTLPSGIILDLDFSVPQIGKWGGVVVGNEKKIEFKIELSTSVNIPYMGTLSGKGVDTAIASVHMKGGRHGLFAAVTAISEVNDLFSEIVFYADVWSMDLKRWNYDCYIEVLITNQYHGKNYCWFILEDEPRTQVHSGMFIRSNTSHTGWDATLELIVLVPDSLPTDVGIWAEGYTFLKLLLPMGITVDLTFYVPRIGAVGGKDVDKDEKEIEFNVELSTTVNVPYMGTVTAKGEDSAVASIHTTGGMNQIHTSVTAQGHSEPLSSEITFYAEVWAEDLEHWHYDCVVDVIIDGLKDGLEIHYEKLLPVFSQES